MFRVCVSVCVRVAGNGNLEKFLVRLPPLVYFYFLLRGVARPSSILRVPLVRALIAFPVDGWSVSWVSQLGAVARTTNDKRAGVQPRSALSKPFALIWQSLFASKRAHLCARGTISYKLCYEKVNHNLEKRQKPVEKRNFAESHKGCFATKDKGRGRGWNSRRFVVGRLTNNNNICWIRKVNQINCFGYSKCQLKKHK